jgi:hypothetical protein
MNRRAVRPALAAVVAAMMLTGCHITPNSTRQNPPSSPSDVVTTAGHGWTSHGIDGPVYAPGSCHYQHGSDGEVLPDPRCTPGALDPAVTAADLHSTICRPGGYTASVRPPERITEPAKKQIMAAYGIPWSQAHRYELDHLIELSAGGASDTRNLWPEPNDDAHQYRRGTYVHNDKDQVEAVTFDAICSGKAKLATAQKAIASNWTTALDVLHLARSER